MPCKPGLAEPIAAAMSLPNVLSMGMLVPEGLSPSKMAATVLGVAVPAGALTGIEML